MKFYTEYADTPETHLNNVSGLYLHGAAEEWAGFDCVSGTSFSNPLPVGLSKVTIVGPPPVGQFVAEEREAFAFVSVCPMRGKKGLIVFGDDLDAIQQAAETVTDESMKI